MRTVRVALTLVLAALAVACALVPPLFATAGRDAFDDAAIVLVIATYAAVGAVIELARPGHPVGRLILLGAVAWGLGEALVAVPLRATVVDEAMALTGVAGTAVRGVGWLLLVVVLPLVFPDGRPPRYAARLAASCIVLFTLGSVLAPMPLEERLAGVDNPVGLSGPWAATADLMAIGALVMASGCLAVAVTRMVRRWRRGDDLERQQVMIFAVTFALPLVLMPLVATPWVEPWMFAVVMVPVPLAVAVALLQRRLYDITIAVNRSVTYVGLSAALACIYALVVGGVGAMLADRGTPWLPWAAAGVVAVAFAPVRDSLQAAANRLTYGRWSAPAEVLAQTGRRLADAADGPALLRALTDELVDGLRLEHVEIVDRTGRVLAASGVNGALSHAVPLTAYGSDVGMLHWSGRSVREHESRLLDDVARQVGGVVHAAGLVEDLRAAQERLVEAREQERRRLRRDLHDGLGPSLAGLGFQVDTISNLVRSGASVDDRLDLLQSGLRETVAEVRRIVDGLRPPALDDLGLFVAVAELGHELVGAAGVDLTLDLPGTRPVLPAAVEVVAYRVAQEALTNVVRHAGATSCRVAATVSRDVLSLDVSDDGGGAGTTSAPARHGLGIGLRSMCERADEIGGRVEVSSLARGTLVSLRLPLGEGAST
ncbi:histidine kinase [Knoellia sp. CPCC 206435]|uniref:sensor histidine kinase n=1 Tax=Knoellia terrae TaxID=3404797 RepID=UPI003B430D5A